MNDAELLRLSRKGDEEAFLVLYRRHQGPVYRFALHMSGRRETAEEVVQEVFLSMLSLANQYASEHGSMQAYLIGIARNQVRKQLKCAPTVQSCSSFRTDEPGTAAGDNLDEVLSQQEELDNLRQRS